MKGNLARMTKGFGLIVLTVICSQLYGESSSIDEPDPFKVVDQCKSNQPDLVSEQNKRASLMDPILKDALCPVYFSKPFPLNMQLLGANDNTGCDCLLHEKFATKYQELKPLIDSYQSDAVLKIKADNYGRDLGNGLNTLREILTSGREDLIKFLTDENNYELAVQCLGTIDKSEGCANKEKEKMIGKASLEKILEMMERSHDSSVFQDKLAKSIEGNGKEGNSSLTSQLASLVLQDPSLDSEITGNNLKVLFEETIKNMVRVSPYVKHPHSKREDLIKASELVIEHLSAAELKTGPTKENLKFLEAREELAKIVASSYVFAGISKHIYKDEENLSKIIQDYQSSLLNKHRYNDKNKKIEELVLDIEKENIQATLYSCAGAAKGLAGLCAQEKLDESDISSMEYILKPEDKTRASLEVQRVNLQHEIANQVIQNDPLRSKQVHAVACYLKRRSGNPAYQSLLNKDVSLELKAKDKIDIEGIPPRAELVSETDELLRRRCAELMIKNKDKILGFGMMSIFNLSDVSKECMQLYGMVVPEVKVKKEAQYSTINEEITRAQRVARKDDYSLKAKVFKSPELQRFYEKIDKGDYVAARNSVAGLGDGFRLTKADYEAPAPLSQNKKVVDAVKEKGDGYTANYSSSLLDFSNKAEYNPTKFLSENKTALAKVSPQNVARLEEVVEEREETVKNIAKTEEEIDKVKKESPNDLNKLNELESRLDSLSNSLDDRDKQIAKLVEENRKLSEQLAKAQAPTQTAPVDTANSTSQKKLSFKPKASTTKVETKIITVQSPVSEAEKKSKEEKQKSEGLALSTQASSGPVVFRGPSSIAQMSIPDSKSEEFKDFAPEAFRLGYAYEEGKVFIYDEEGKLKILEEKGGKYELRDAPYTINPKSEIHLMDQEDFLESSLGDEVIDSSKKGPIRYPEIPSILDQYFGPK